MDVGGDATCNDEAFGHAIEQALRWVQQPPSTPKEGEECLRWLSECPIHVREALAALAWIEDIQEFFRYAHGIDVRELISKATNV